ncbi:hypothetical protein SALBM311S_09823 [Streptomyces alboniger]
MLRPFHRGPSGRASDATHQELLDAYEQGRSAQQCFTGFVHGDFSLRNVLLSGGRVSGLVDFERSGAGCPYHDLASVFLNDVLLGSLSGDRLLSAYATGGAQRGEPTEVNRAHLRRHIVEYCCWILDWAPALDSALAASIRGLAPRLLERNTL